MKVTIQASSCKYLQADQKSSNAKRNKECFEVSELKVAGDAHAGV